MANVVSILKTGLKEPGEKDANGKTINVRDNHYKINNTYYGVENWAKAIFVSPSLLYASDICYAERFIDDDN